MRHVLPLWITSFTQQIRRWVLFVCLAVLSFTTVLAMPVRSLQSPPTTPVILTQDRDANQWIQQGNEFYELEQYQQAIASWDSALSALGDTDEITQASVYSNLSLAYQQLGNWDAAERAIAQSLSLLNLDTDQSPSALTTYAKALNTQGRLYWSQGQLEASLSTWQEATRIYDEAGDIEGIILSSINQARALQSLGFSVEAADTLHNLTEIVETADLDPNLQATRHWNLGNAYRRIGRLAESLASLDTGLAIAQDDQLTSLIPGITLDLGNTERALGNRAIAIGQTTDADEHHNNALAFYRQVSSADSHPRLQLRARLNQLSLLTEQGNLAEVPALWSNIQPQLEQQSNGRSTIFAMLNAAHSLTCGQRQINPSLMNCSKREQAIDHSQHHDSLPSWTDIAQLLATAVNNAQAIADVRAESYALGQLGELYELTGQWQEARTLTEQALWKAEQLQAPDIRYRWEWQLARLAEVEQQRPTALLAYQSAFETLKSVRSDLLTVDSDLQFSFRDNVEPIYRNYVDLLLKPEDQQTVTPDELTEAIGVIDALQLAELENFLRCNFIQDTDIDTNQSPEAVIEQIDPTAALIYPIILSDRIEVIAKFPNQAPQHYATSIPQADVKQVLKDLTDLMANPMEPISALQERSTQVYNWIIRPLEPVLAQNDTVQTLVFVLDGSLRNIPMSVLHDGEQYLLQKPYDIALVPSLQLFDLRTPQQDNLTILAAGISEAMVVENRQFVELPGVEAELEQIQQVAPTTILLNNEFTEEQLKTLIDSREFSAVHVATHGKFSSDPEETFILAYRELLKSDHLNNLLRTETQDRSDYIDLFVLSACETAQGDNRAVLGLAGIAVRAGALSTVSTLWLVNDQSTATVMSEFYRQLATSEVSKARALHQAQLALFNRGFDYESPFLWAPYVLVGNWL